MVEENVNYKNHALNAVTVNNFYMTFHGCERVSHTLWLLRVGPQSLMPVTDVLRVHNHHNESTQRAANTSTDPAVQE
jgi:hypothetical protein